MSQLADIVSELTSIEERLRDLAYERLEAAVGDGDASAAADERRILQARRAVARALQALGGAPEEDHA